MKWTIGAGLLCGTACCVGSELFAGEIAVESAQVRLIEDVEVPAQAKGVLKSLAVREGDVVGSGDAIAQLDAAEAKLLHERAQIDLDTAQKREKNDVKLRLAGKSVDDAKLAVERARLNLEIAARQAENDTAVRLAKKTSAVAVTELGRALRSRARIADAVSQSEVDMLQLSVDRSALEIEKANIDHQVAEMTARVEEAELNRLKLGIETAALDEEQARRELEVAVDDRRAKANELQMAQLNLERRHIVSPVSGVVMKVFHRPGEWVEPGETVMRIVRMDRLRIEGFIAAEAVRGGLNGAAAVISVRGGGKKESRFDGTLVFVSPEVDPVNDQVRVWAEVDNPDMQLRPGMRVTMTIQTPDE